MVLRSRCPAPTGRDRSFFVVTPRRDEPGSLVRLLQEFSVRGINLTTIESRPTRALLGEYRFLIECEGHVADAHVRDAVLGLLRFPGEVRFLGSFPEDAARRGHAPGARAPRAGRARLRADAGAGRGVRTGVVGLGLIGGSLLRALGGAGYDADPAVRAAAAAEGFEVADELAGLAGCELVLVAVPPARTADVLGEVLEALPDALVADTTSVKAPLPRHERLVGAHPMAGAETAGWAASTAVLLQGAPWAACPAGEALEPLLALSAAVDALGGRIVACTPEEHDAAVARTSHVPHLAAQALAGLAADGGLQAALAGTAFRDMTRVARADADAVDGDPRRQPRRLPGRRRRAGRAPRRAARRARRRGGDPHRVGARPGVARGRRRRPLARARAGARSPSTAGPACSSTAARGARCAGSGAPRRRCCTPRGGPVRRRFDPSGPLRGTLAAPADKSLSTAPRCSPR